VPSTLHLDSFGERAITSEIPLLSIIGLQPNRECSTENRRAVNCSSQKACQAMTSIGHSCGHRQVQCQDKTMGTLGVQITSIAVFRHNYVGNCSYLVLCPQLDLLNITQWAPSNCLFILRLQTVHGRLIVYICVCVREGRVLVCLCI
jgi:hypothetical protein